MNSRPHLSAQPVQHPWLVADIGGTNARFGLVRGPGCAVTDIRTLKCAAHRTLESAARDYLEALSGGEGVAVQPRYAALALASAIDGETVKMTNGPWDVSRSTLQRALGLRRIGILNDFEALALALPHLQVEDVRTLGGPGSGALDSTRPMGVVGPGTGLGVAACVPVGEQRWVALSTEGGHVTLAAADEFEAELLRAARQEHAHVSAERFLSGIGLPTLHRAVLTVLGQAPDLLPAELITARADAGDPACERTLETFCAMLGTFTGNAALTFGARGGMLVAGGIAQRLADRLVRSRFRARFEGKGRFAEYLAPVATCVLAAPHAALTGAAQCISNWLSGDP